MADDEAQFVPEGPLAQQPVYADAHVVHQIVDTMTFWFMRIPPVFTPKQLAELHTAHPGEVHGQTVAAVTMVSELALKLADSIYKLAGKTPPEGRQ